MLILTLLLAIPLPKAPSDTVTVEQVMASYEETFEVVVLPMGDDTLFAVVVPRELGGDNPLADFERDNGFFLTYLMGNAISFDRAELFEAEVPIEERKRSFYGALRSDQRFSEALLTAFGRYLSSRGGVLVGWDHDGGVQSVTEGDLQRLAVRFFYPDAVTEDGRLAGHICVGINGLEDFDWDRDVLVEAFVYATIFRALREERYGLDEEFQAALEAAENLALSVDEETRITRAQGAVWAVLARSENIRKMLRESYELREAYLPFRIVR
jgi:PAS domain-containing protein